MKRKGKIAAFIGIEFGLVILCTLPLFLLHAKPASPLMFLTSVVFMFLPTLTTLIVKRLAHDDGELFLRLNMRKAWKQYLLAAFVPGVLEGIGATLYFFIFPNHFDLSLTYAAQLLALNGQTAELPQLSLPFVIGAGLILILTAPLVIVNHVAALGEEIGWRSFLLPLLIDELGVQKAVLLDGVLLSYLTLRSRSIFPACIAHGAINAIREVPLLVCLDNFNALLGPKPSGLIGMTGFLVLGAVIFVRFAQHPEMQEDR